MTQTGQYALTLTKNYDLKSLYCIVTQSLPNYQIAQFKSSPIIYYNNVISITHN